MHRIALSYGAAEPLRLDVGPASLVANLAGPVGSTGAAAATVVAAATSAPPDGPPLSAFAVPGDRVVIAIAGAVPQAPHVVATVMEQLAAAGVDPAGISVLHAGPPVTGLGNAQEFHSDTVSETAYLAADEAGRPLHVARALVDADVVVTVGEWAYDARLGGRAVAGELWPAFGRAECDATLMLDLARRGRRALRPWSRNVQTLTWQLGVTSCLRLVAGRDGTLAFAAFGTADAAARHARKAAAAWAPTVATPADLAICSVSQPTAGFDAIARAVAAAARITPPTGTICVATTTAEAPGPVVTRWRQGAPLQPLVREACASGDPRLVADAVVARFLARALEDRRLVLLSNLDEAMVEDLEFGFAANPDTVHRLIRRSDGVAILHEADLLFPHLD
ncbi:MAG: hypothetical protein WCR51_05835 [Planctomycetia bacterium]